MGSRQRLALTLALAGVLLGLPAGAVFGGGVLDELARVGSQPASGQREFLPPDQAFRVEGTTRADGTLELAFDIAPGYYLYRDRFAVTPASAGVAFGALRLPPSVPKDDPEFGQVEVYTEDMAIAVPLAEAPAGAGPIEADVRYQGCAEDGLCYPPIDRTIAFTWPAGASASGTAAPASPLAPPTATGQSLSDRIAQQLSERSLIVTLASFFVLGLLLAFTPCVLPMIPILSGIIVGQRQPLSAPRAMALSAVYVLAMALTYALAGVAAGLLGHNLQAAFQHPAVIAGFAALFVVLALSMFGFYTLQAPAALQARLDRFSRAQRGGRLGGVAVMGVLSAIIVGPCVAPPLAGALAYIGTTGSAVVGGSALFALGLGMGAPLFAVGASAGALLPRAGVWMKRVQQAFGVIFLGVAVWFLERIVPGPLALVLWAALALGTAVALGALARTERAASTATHLAQALGLGLLLYGAVLIVGAAAGAGNPLAPLAPLVAARHEAAPALPFRAVKSTAEVAAEVAAAGAAGRTVMLDFYADWCIECKHLERETFTAPAVSRRLAGMTLLRADVTANDAVDRALLARYDLYGPPAVLFFNDGAERRDQRLIGFVEAAAFTDVLDAVTAP